jgi:hypothetical protein
MKHIASVLNSHCRIDSNKQILVPFESSPLSCIWYGFKPHNGKKMVGYILKDGYKYPYEKSIIRNGLMVEIKYPEQIFAPRASSLELAKQMTERMIKRGMLYVYPYTWRRKR